MSRLNKLLYRYRIPAILVSLVLILYTNIYIWAFIPFSDFDFNYRPESKMHITGIFDEDAATQDLLQADDVVLAIEGKPINRAAAIYPLLKQASYAFTLQRGDEILSVDVPFPEAPGSLATSYRLPSGVLSLITWLVGMIALYFARSDNKQAIHLGYHFLLLSVFTIGIQGSLLNAPGTWLLGTPLMAIIGLGWVYLGFIPRTDGLGWLPRRILSLLAMGAALFTAASLFEGFFLFPRFSSFEEAVGIGLYANGVTFLGIGLLSTVPILTWRIVRMKRSYLRQQLTILLLCIGLAIVPAVFLTFLPRSLADFTILPFPVTLSLLVLVPAGYFYVIFRRGYLGLDRFFNRSLMLIIMSVVMVALFGSVLYIMQVSHAGSYLSFQNDPILPAISVFLPTLLITIFLTDRVDYFVKRLLYGESAMQKEVIPEFASALSARPEYHTLGTILQRLADDFKVACAALMLTNEQGYLIPVAQVDFGNWNTLHVRSLDQFQTPLLRSAIPRRGQRAHPLFEVMPWAELLLPVTIRKEQIGFLAMARPAPDGFFNAQQVSFLTRVADMIAVGSEAIHLFAAAHKLSQKLLNAQENERRLLASQIHDRPLQAVTAAVQQVHICATEISDDYPETAQRLRQQGEDLKVTSRDLRNIVTDLYPPVIEFGAEIVIRDVVGKFQEKGLNIDLQLDVPKDAYHPAEISAVVYQVATESLNNVVKHAGVTDVTVDLNQQKSDNKLSLKITDKGKGSTFAHLTATECLRFQHFGLLGMFEAAERVNGWFSLQRNQPAGTCVTLEIPLI